MDAYLGLLQQQLVLRRGPDSDESDTEDHRLADEMDTVWRRMTQDERDAVNARAEVLLRREEVRHEVNNLLKQLREYINQVDPTAQKKPALTKRMASMLGPSVGFKPFEMEHLELATDLSQIAQQFQLLDEKIMEHGILPDAWQPKESKRYVIRLIFQLFHKEGAIFEVATKEECAKRCAELTSKGLESGWMPRIEQAPIEEMVWLSDHQQFWQAPDGMCYLAELQNRPGPKSVEWTSVQKERRYWSAVFQVATRVVSGVLRGMLKDCGSMGPSDRLNFWISVESECLSDGLRYVWQTSERLFIEDVRSLLRRQGFRVEAENLEDWKEHAQDMSQDPKNLTT
jgi:hypothetical protein